MMQSVYDLSDFAVVMFKNVKISYSCFINPCRSNVAASRYREAPRMLLGAANAHRSKAWYRTSNFPTLLLVPLAPCKCNYILKQWPQTMQSYSMCDFAYSLAS